MAKYLHFLDLFDKWLIFNNNKVDLQLELTTHSLRNIDHRRSL